MIAGSLCTPQGKAATGAVLLVHASRHERDAYGDISIPGLPQSLCRHGLATLRIDIRGRGASQGERAFQSMSPGERAGVRLDVDAAVDYLARLPAIDSSRIAIVAEQDSANPAVMAGSRDRRVAAFVLISGRLSEAALSGLARRPRPVFCLVSKEDRRGFKDMVDAYLASKSRASRLSVFEGLALGTTMFSTWRHEFPGEEPIEEGAADWLAARLRTGRLTGSPKGKAVRKGRAL